MFCVQMVECGIPAVGDGPDVCGREECMNGLIWDAFGVGVRCGNCCDSCQIGQLRSGSCARCACARLEDVQRSQGEIDEPFKCFVFAAGVSRVPRHADVGWILHSVVTRSPKAVCGTHWETFPPLSAYLCIEREQLLLPLLTHSLTLWQVGSLAGPFTCSHVKVTRADGPRAPAARRMVSGWRGAGNIAALYHGEERGPGDRD